MGGARIGAGRKPEMDALRRDRPSDQATWTHLPSIGRLGDAPEWPLSRATARERELWVQDWRRPQAFMWEANGLEREVAMYVRALAVAERPKASVPQRTLVRQYADALGLSLTGMRAHRWIIDQDPVAPPEPQTSAQARASARERFKVVGDAG